MSEPFKAARLAAMGIHAGGYLKHSLQSCADIDKLATIIDTAMRPEREATKALVEAVSNRVNLAEKRVGSGAEPSLSEALAAYRASTGEK